MWTPSGTPRTYRALALFAALLVCFAGFGKTQLYHNVPCSRDPLFGSHPLLGALGYAELCFGLFALGLHATFPGWLLLVVSFAGYAAVNVVSLGIGVAECGCLGVVRPSVWSMFFLDMGVFLCLLTFRPAAFRPLRNTAGLTNRGARATALVLAVAATLAPYSG